jgi:hypothetical protein
MVGQEVKNIDLGNSFFHKQFLDHKQAESRPGVAGLFLLQADYFF